MSPKTKKYLMIAAPLALGLLVIVIAARKAKRKEQEDILPEDETLLPVPVKDPTFPLKQGSRNAKVTELQKILGVVADGIFGAKTEAALLAYAGLRSVASEAELATLKNKSIGLTNQLRASDLLRKFTAGGVSLYAIKTVLCTQVIVDGYGAIIPTGKAFNLTGGKTYNSNDYKLIMSTKAGKLVFEVTQGSLAGLYTVDPNSVTLK